MILGAFQGQRVEGAHGLSYMGVFCGKIGPLAPGLSPQSLDYTLCSLQKARMTTKEGQSNKADSTPRESITLHNLVPKWESVSLIEKLFFFSPKSFQQWPPAHSPKNRPIHISHTDQFMNSTPLPWTCLFFPR